jgi:hypothetical protein
MIERYGVIEHTQDKRAILHLLSHREVCEGWISKWPTHCQEVFQIYPESKLPEGYIKKPKSILKPELSKSWWFQDRYYVHMTKTTQQGTWWGRIDWKPDPRQIGLESVGRFMCDTTKEARQKALAIINRHRKEKSEHE